MIMRSDFTIEDLKQDEDPLSYVCHSISKLKMIGNVIQTNSDNTDVPPMEVFRPEDVWAMGELVEDSALEIEILVDVAQNILSEISHENRSLKGRVHELEAQLKISQTKEG